MTSEKITFPMTLMKLVMLTAPASYCESNYKERREARGGRNKRRIRWSKGRRTG